MMRYRRTKNLRILLVAFLLFSTASEAAAMVACSHREGDSCCVTWAVPVKPANAGSLSRMVEGSAHGDVEQQIKVATNRAGHCGAQRDNPGQTDSAASQRDLCAACFSGSRSGEVVSIAFGVRNSQTRLDIPDRLGSFSIPPVFTSPVVAELHEHSPPGSSAARHILISVFRI